jgi:hypothetical protein
MNTSEINPGIPHLQTNPCFSMLQLRLLQEPGSSVSLVSDYGLDDRGSIPDRGRGYFF